MSTKLWLNINTLSLLVKYEFVRNSSSQNPTVLPTSLDFFQLVTHYRHVGENWSFLRLRGDFWKLYHKLNIKFM